MTITRLRTKETINLVAFLPVVPWKRKIGFVSTSPGDTSILHIGILCCKFLAYKQRKQFSALNFSENKDVDSVDT